MKPLVVFSPYLPSRNGIAEGCSVLLPYHARTYDCYLVIPDHAADPVSVPDGVEVLRYADWRHHYAILSRYRHLYHVGNNDEHDYVYEASIRNPGILFLHDYVLHHLVALQTLVRGDRDSYVETLVREHGLAGKRLAEQYLLGLGTPYFQPLLPISGQLIDRARAVVSYSQYITQRVRARRPDTPAVQVPHYAVEWTKLTARNSKAEARRDLGLGRDSLVIASLGFTGPQKQVGSVIEAVARLIRRGLNIEYVIGGVIDPALNLIGQIEALGVTDRVKATGYMTESSFFETLVAADLLVNLRFPSSGEMSGPLVRALTVGCPVMVSNSGNFRFLPDDVVFKIPPSSEPSSDVQRCLVQIYNDRPMLAGLAERGKQYAHATYRTEETARGVHRAIESGYDVPQPASNLTSERHTFTFRPPAAHAAAIAKELAEVVKNGGSTVKRARGSCWELNLVPLAAPSTRLLILEAGEDTPVKDTATRLGYADSRATALSEASIQREWQRLFDHRLGVTAGAQEPGFVEWGSYNFALAVASTSIITSRADAWIGVCAAALAIGGRFVFSILDDPSWLFETGLAATMPHDPRRTLAIEATDTIAEDFERFGFGDVCFFPGGGLLGGWSQQAEASEFSEITIVGRKVSNFCDFAITRPNAAQHGGLRVHRSSQFGATRNDVTRQSAGTSAVHRGIGRQAAAAPQRR